MEVTENQKALLKEIGLKAKDLGYGLVKIVKAVGEEVPQGTEISDIYYPTLFQKVVTQEVTENIRVFALEEGVFLKEAWQNGIKEWLYNGIVELKDYSKAITIADFNPADPTQYAIKYSIDFTKYADIKYSKNEILQAFTTPATLESFVNQIIRRLTDTTRYFIQNEKAKILSGDTSAVLSIEWDEIVDVTGVETIDILRELIHYMEAMRTASPDWLAVEDDTVIYSATPENLSIVMRPFFKADIAKLESTLFNANAVISDKIKNAPTIDMLKAGIAESGHVLNLIDNRALTIGYQVDNISWDVKLPKLQTKMELHNWFGFGSNPALYKSIWTNNTEALTGKNAKLKKRITKLKDVIDKRKAK